MYRFGVFVLLLFVVSIIFSIFYINTWSESLTQKLNLANIQDLKVFNESVSNLFFIFTLSAALGLLSNLFFLSGMRYRSKIIYVDKQQEYKQDLQTALETDNEKLSSEIKFNDLLNEFKRFLATHKSPTNFLEKALWQIAKSVEAVQGAIYLVKYDSEKATVEQAATYAYYSAEDKLQRFEVGEGLIGQVAKDGKFISLKSIPEGYLAIVSGLGNAAPNALFLAPIIDVEKKILGVLELATFVQLDEQYEKLLQDMALLLAKEILQNEYQDQTSQI
ncbi:MAG TPA: hypothetical protein DCM08_01355 [Microscillaceae bacterium]|jgi:nitrate/nitrite-specific signal transduction histidine kinase|nr:hypothetical protein [Microscillaceae bacterium]